MANSECTVALRKLLGATVFMRLIFESSERDGYKSYGSLDEALSDTNGLRGKKVYRAEIEYLGKVSQKLTLITEFEELVTMKAGKKE